MDVNVPAGLAVLIYFIVRHWRRKKGNKNVKATAVEDRGPSEEEKEARKHEETKRNVWQGLLGFLGSSYTGKP